MTDDPIPLYPETVLTSPAFMERTIFENWFMVLVYAHEELHGPIDGDRELLALMFRRYMEDDPYLAGMTPEVLTKIEESCLNVGVEYSTKEEGEEEWSRGRKS